MAMQPSKERSGNIDRLDEDLVIVVGDNALVITLGNAEKLRHSGEGGTGIVAVDVGFCKLPERIIEDGSWA